MPRSGRSGLTGVPVPKPLVALPTRCSCSCSAAVAGHPTCHLAWGSRGFRCRFFCTAHLCIVQVPHSKLFCLGVPSVACLFSLWIFFLCPFPHPLGLLPGSQSAVFSRYETACHSLRGTRSIKRGKKTSVRFHLAGRTLLAVVDRFPVVPHCDSSSLLSETFRLGRKACSEAARSTQVDNGQGELAGCKCKLICHVADHSVRMCCTARH